MNTDHGLDLAVVGNGRTAALIDAPAGVAVDAWPAVFDVDEQFYFKPDATRLLVSPAEEEPRPPGDVWSTHGD